MSSNSTLVGEGLPALEMLNFHGNGSETPASRSIFPLLLSPFIFRPLVPPLPLPPTRDRMSTRFIPLLPPLSSLAPIISFARSTSFHLLDYRVCCFVREKSSVRWPFSGGNRTVCQCVFYPGGQSTHTNTYTRSLVNRLFCDVTGVSVYRSIEREIRFRRELWVCA